MSGYSGFSKSNNAVAAESAGRYPASKAAKLCGVPVAFIRDCCGFAGGEWHHSSKFYNVVSYYDTDAILAWLNDERGDDGDFLHGTSGSLRLAEWRDQQKVVPATTTHTDCSVNWLEWGGTRKHPKATKRSAAPCTVIDGGGKFVTIILPEGKSMKKGRDTNGFEVWKDGKRVSI